MGVFLCWRCEVGDLMTRGDVVGEMPQLCSPLGAIVAVAQLEECSMLLISQTLCLAER